MAAEPTSPLFAIPELAAEVAALARAGLAIAYADLDPRDVVVVNGPAGTLLIRDGIPLADQLWGMRLVRDAIKSGVATTVLVPDAPFRHGMHVVNDGVANRRSHTMPASQLPQPCQPTPPRTDVAHPARVYDAWLDGKTNYMADRVAADATAAHWPNIVLSARSNRAFMLRSARYSAGRGITQFLDLGAGIPTEPNLNQVVQEINPAAAVVYVDNDPIVLAHSAALTTSTAAGAVDYLLGDVREVEALIGSERLRATIDLDWPVAVGMVALLHFLDDEQAVHVVRTVMAAVPTGSSLTISHSTLDADDTGVIRQAMESYRATGIATWIRSRADLERLFLPGLELLDPGIVMTHRWRPDDERMATAADSQVNVLGLVAIKP